MATPALAAFAPSTASSTNGKASRGRRITILSQNKGHKVDGHMVPAQHPLNTVCLVFHLESQLVSDGGVGLSKELPTIISYRLL